MNFLIPLFFLLSTGLAFAHNPEISYIILTEKNDKWTLQVRASLTSFQYQIKHNYKKNRFLSKKEFDKKLLRYLENHICITFDHHKIILEKDYLEIDHETAASFTLMNVPDSFKSFSVRNTCFIDIPNNKSVLIIFKDGFSREEFMLSKENHHTLTVRLEKTRFVEQKEKVNNTKGSQKINYLIIGFVFTFLIFLRIKKV